MLGGPLQKIVLRLETGAGVVPVELEREGARIGFGWMDQPIPAVGDASRRPTSCCRVLGLERSGLPVELYHLGPSFVYVELELARAGRRARARLRGASSASPTPA